MYQVQQHKEGIKASIGETGLLWENDSGGHEWECIGQFRRKDAAISAAAANPIHTTVVRDWSGTEIEYDNGKAPGSRVRDCRTDKSIPIRAPRDLRAYRFEAP